MQIGTARVNSVDQRQKAEFWMLQVTKWAKRGDFKKSKLAMQMALGHVHLAETYEEWMDVSKREEG